MDSPAKKPRRGAKYFFTAEEVAAQRIAQGLSAKVEDPTALAKLARLLIYDKR